MSMNRREASAAMFAGAVGLVTNAAIGHEQTGSLRNSTAEEQIIALLHQLHGAFENRDLQFIGNLISKADFLASFEIAPDGGPMIVTSREQMLAYLTKVFAHYGKSAQVAIKTNPRVPHTAIASNNFGVTVEQCVLDATLSDGTPEKLNMRGTTAFRREADGWKIVHWHVSTG